MLSRRGEKKDRGGKGVDNAGCPAVDNFFVHYNMP
jgi:hypothetical protein